MIEIKQIKINSNQNTKELVKSKLLLNPWVEKALAEKIELDEAEEYVEEALPEDNNQPKAAPTKEKRHLQMRMNVSINMMQKLKM
jgi:hypothetical protein